MLSYERLCELLSYDPDTGLFIWLKKTSTYSRIQVGTVAGAIWKTGRRVIKIYGRLYYAYRLAWLYMTGEWPDKDIDHIDRDPGNDRWNNLRIASRAQQSWNIGRRRVNKSGYIGVRQTPENTWRVDIRNGDRRHKEHLGTFKTAEDAARAYDNRIREMRGSFAVTNFTDGGFH